MPIFLMNLAIEDDIEAPETQFIGRISSNDSWISDQYSGSSERIFESFKFGFL